MTTQYAPSPRWDLDSIYAGGAGDAPATNALNDVQARLTSLLEAFSALRPLDEAGSAAGWTEVMLALEQVDDAFSTVATKAWCHFSDDVNDAAAVEMVAKLGELQTLRAQIDVPLRATLAASSDASFAAFMGRDEVAHMSTHLAEERDRAAIAMEPKLEALQSELARDGFHAWGRLYSVISGGLSVTLDRGDGPETLSTEQARQLLDHPEADFRRKVAASVTEAWSTQKSVFAAALNHINGYRQVVYGRRGIDELEVPLRNNRISRASLEVMFDEIRNFRPVMARFLRAKARLLGLEKLSWYDLGVSLGKVGGTVTYEAAQDFINEHFSGFADRLGDFSRHAFASRWIEVEDRPGKRQGGFCAAVPLTGESRIFMTFGGKPSAIQTLAHELGHAYHNWVLKELPAYQREFPNTLAETASTFAESIVREAAYREASDDEVRLGMLNRKLMDASAMLNNIPARFHFERAMYAERGKKELSADRFSELTVDAWKDAYADCLDVYDETFWASKLHFYLSDSPFYNFPYTVGFLFSSGLYAAAVAEGDRFASKYDHCLVLTGSHSCEEVAQQALGVDLSKPDFWRSAMAVIEADVAEFERLVAA